MTLRYGLNDARDAVSVTETSKTRSRTRNDRCTTPSAFGLGAFFVSAAKFARALDSAGASGFIALPLPALLIQPPPLAYTGLGLVASSLVRPRPQKRAFRSGKVSANLRSGTTEF